MTLPDAPQTLAELQAAYLRALRAGAGRAADRVIEVALQEAVTPQQIYLNIFQPAAYALGHLWQHNHISVAQEHLATAIIERHMGELHPLFKSQGRRDRTLVIGCVPGEWHRVGARMVADFFEADGWEVHYLGASVPIADMVGLARETGADVVGVAAQMLFSLPQVGEFSRALRAAGLADIPVIAGGLPFVHQPAIAAPLNVTGCTGDAATALAVADQLLPPAHFQPRPAQEALAGLALRRVRERLIAIATERCATLSGGDEESVRLIRSGFDFTTRMLEAALAVGQPALLDAQVAWANDRQPHDGITPVQMLGRLNNYATALDELLAPPDGPIVARYVDRLITCQRRALGAL